MESERASMPSSPNTKNTAVSGRGRRVSITRAKTVFLQNSRSGKDLTEKHHFSTSKRIKTKEKGGGERGANCNGSAEDSVEKKSTVRNHHWFELDQGGGGGE